MRRGDVFFGGKKVFFSTERERRKKKSNGSIKSLEPVCLLFIKSMARASLLPLPRSIRGMKPSLFLSPLGGGGNNRGGRGEGVLGREGKEEGRQELPFLIFFLPLPLSTLPLSLFRLLLTRAGLTTRLPYPRGSLTTFISVPMPSRTIYGDTHIKRKMIRKK